MKLPFAFFLMIFTCSAFSEVNHAHVESMLKQMVRENVISQEEAEKAKIRMKSMTPQQWSAINQQAGQVAARSPASVTPSQNKIEEVNSIDLDGAQFKAIENEVRKIIPQYKD
jgi:predicted Zn-dependent peptidase